MISWELKVDQFYESNISKDALYKVLNNANKTVELCMDYFSKKLSEIDNWSVEDAKIIFGEIADDLPIMTYYITNDGQFILRYNRYIHAIFTNSIKQIYREQKINKIL
jgi:hypothetical protein